MKAVAGGKSLAEIAREQGQPPVNIQKRMQTIRKALGARTSSDAAERAVQLRILPRLKVVEKNVLSPFERQVLSEYARGLRAAEIAAKLGVSRHQVKNAYQMAEAKLRVESIGAAVREAKSLDILDAEMLPTLVRRYVRTGRRSPSLTPRQEQLYDLLKRGIRRYSELAGRMGVCEGTVGVHLRHLRAKLGNSFTLD